MKYEVISRNDSFFECIRLMKPQRAYSRWVPRFKSMIFVNSCIIVLLVLASYSRMLNMSMLTSTYLLSPRKHYFYMRHRDGAALPSCVDLRPRPASRYAILVVHVGKHDGFFISALKMSVRLHLYVQTIRQETDFVLDMVRAVPPRVTDTDVLSALRAGYDQVCHSRPMHGSIYGGYYNRWVIFNMTQYDSILYLDSDIMPVNDVSDLIVNGTLALQSAGKHLMWAREIEANWFNSGVMLVLPDPAISNELMGLLNQLLASGYIHYVENDRKGINPKDQAFMNQVFHARKGNALRMSEKYNACLHEQTVASEDVLRYAHLIHFTGGKPWEQSTCYWKEHHRKICDLWLATPTVLSRDFLDAKQLH